MAASEHTPKMRLSQFGPDDRPSWIDDYNADMRIIDTALEQSVGSTGAVGQTARFTKRATVDGGVSAGNTFSLYFESPWRTETRNAEPADVPWTWKPDGDRVSLSLDEGVYRVTVEANATYEQSLNISSASIRLGESIAPFVYYGKNRNGPCFYNATSLFVLPHDSGGFDIDFRLVTIFNDPIVSDAQVTCTLSVDVEQLSTAYSVQLSQ